MNAFELYCDYIAARRQANELDNIARKLRSIANSYLPQTNDKLNGNWNGTASEAFLSKQNRRLGQIEAQANSLQQAADTIRRIAKRTYDTEMKALEMSKTRTYG